MGDRSERAADPDLLILYNPYYQENVVEKHVEVLQEAVDPLQARVAFGKVRSKLRDYEHPFAETLEALYARCSERRPLQLFLTDYSDLYVARVVEITREDRSRIAPAYYRQKELEVERWFVLSDIRQLVRKDFELLRDRYLARMTTPNFGGHHYAIYGNSYVYPLVVESEEPLDYFDYDDEESRCFPLIYKSEARQAIRRRLIDYRFGAELFNRLHPNTQDALISAEMEWEENRADPLYDYSAVIIKYSKAFERELWLFGRRLFASLIERDPRLRSTDYRVQGVHYTLSDYRLFKPNVGTTKYLLKLEQIQHAVAKEIQDPLLKIYLRYLLPLQIDTLQKLRNEAVHGEAANFEACTEFRSKVLGIGENGVICDLLGYAEAISPAEDRKVNQDRKE
jgi:hypothetical protein